MAYKKREISGTEISIYVPAVLNFLHTCKGKDNAMTNGQIRYELDKLGLSSDAVRVRRVIRYIRQNQMIKGLLASNRGYYISDDPSEMQRYIDLLNKMEAAFRTLKEMVTAERGAFLENGLASQLPPEIAL